MEKTNQISFVPDWKIMLLGRSHFERPVDAMAEFIDNSIQACMWEEKCEISCNLFIQASSTKGSCSYLVFLDNGEGMDINGIQQFATFARGKSDKGQAPTASSREGKMFIGKFGVGAKQAGFYLGDRIIVLSKPKDQVFRFSLDEHSKSSKINSDADSSSTENPFQGVVDTLNIATYNQRLVPLMDGEQEPLCYSKLEELVKSHMVKCKNGTAIVIRLRDDITKIFRQDLLANLSKNLKDIYHFHINPKEIRFVDIATNSRYQSTQIGKPVHIDVCWNGYNHYGLREELEMKLDNHVIDYIDECKIRDRRPFEVMMTIPEVPHEKKKEVHIFGMFWYLPFEDDKEQRPELPTMMPSSSFSLSSSTSSSTGAGASESDYTNQEFSNNCIIRCYWQNRLVPWSILKNLPFMSGADSLRTISPKWRKRIVGILFLDWNFDDIANNKLRFRQNLEDILFQNRDISISPVGARDGFCRWLEAQCKLDKEFHFFEIHTDEGFNNGANPIFKKLRYNGGRLLQAGEKVLLPLSESTDNPPTLAVEIVGFSPAKVLSHAQTSYNGAGMILYKRLPSEIYGSKGNGQVATKILYYHQSIKPLPPNSIRELDRLKSPSIVVSIFKTAAGDPTVIENNSFSMTLGQALYKIGVQIFNDKTVVWYPPGLTDEKANRYFIKASLLDEKGKVVRDWQRDNQLFSYDEQKGDDIEKRITSQKMAKQSYYSLYNISQGTFKGQCGTFRLKFSVLNPDGVEFFERSRPIEIKVTQQEVSKVELINKGNSDPLSMKLGDCIPTLQFRFYDKDNQIMTFSESINWMATIVSNEFDVILVDNNRGGSSSPSGSASSQKQNASSMVCVPLKQCKIDDNVLKINNNVWKIVPKPSSGMMNNKRVQRSKPYQFAIKLSSPSSSRVHEIKFNIAVSPGVPSQILSATPIQVKLNNETKSLLLSVTDAWGNRVAPLETAEEQWRVQFVDGPLMFINPSEQVFVNSSGEIVCVNSIKSVEDFETTDDSVEQGVLLKSTTTRDDLLEQYLKVEIVPSNVPKTLVVFHNGNRLEEDDKITVTAGSTINNLTYEILDDVGHNVKNFEDALVTFRTKLKRNNAKQTSQEVGGRLPNIKVQEQVGDFSVAYNAILNGVNLPFELFINVVADKPVRWMLECKAAVSNLRFTAGNISKELYELAGIEASFEDKYKNEVSISALAGTKYKPILEIISQSHQSSDANAMDLVTDSEDNVVARIPLVLPQEKVTTGTKRKLNSASSNNDDDAKALYVLPETLSKDVKNTLDNLLRPGQTILLRVVDGASSSTGNTEPHNGSVANSNEVSFLIGNGIPSQLLLSTEQYHVMDPVVNGSITMSIRDALNDLKVNVLDKFGNQLDLRSFSIALLGVYVNEQGFPTHSIREVRNPNLLLTNRVELPHQILDRIIDEAVAAHQSKQNSGGSSDGDMDIKFSLRFALSLFKANNAEKLELSPAILQCRVVIKNNVSRIEAGLREQDQSLLVAPPSLNTNVRTRPQAMIRAGSSLPPLMIKLITENGKPIIVGEDCNWMEWIDVKVWKVVSRGTQSEQTEVNWKNVFTGKVTMKESPQQAVNDIQSVVHQWLEVEPIPSFVLTDAKLIYRIDVTFHEQRSMMDKLRPETSMLFTVAPNEPCKLQLTEEYLRRMKSVVCVTNTKVGQSEVLGHIGKDVYVSVTDQYDNVIVDSNGLNVTCGITSIDGNQDTSRFPILASTPSVKSPKEAIWKFRSIALEGATKNSQALDGRYCLCFYLYNEQQRLLAINNTFQFDFTSNDTYSRRMNELQEELRPWQDKVTEFTELQRQSLILSQKRQSCCQQLQVGDFPGLERELIERKNSIQQTMQSILTKKQNVRAARKRVSQDMEDKLSRLIASSQEGSIIGRVVDLALVKDSRYIDIVSSACRRIIDAVVTKDSRTAKRLWEEKIKSLSLDMIVPFKQNNRERSGNSLVHGELPLTPILMPDAINPSKVVEAKGNPKYLVNLLYLNPRDEYLRSTIFYNLLKNAIVFDDYWQAVEYRKYLTRIHMPCPTLYCLDGRQIGKDGVLDPNERNSLQGLDFVFGEYFGGDERINELREESNIIEQLLETATSMAKLQEKIQAATDEMDDVQRNIERIKNEQQSLKQMAGVR